MVWSYLGLIGDVLVGAGLVAYIARAVPLAAYGVLLFALSATAIVAMLDLGLSNILVPAYIALKGERQAVERLLGTTWVLLSGIGGLGIIVFAGVARLLPGPFNLPREYLHDARIVVVLAAAGVAVGMSALPMELLLQAVHRFDRLNQLRLLLLIPQLGLSVAAIRMGYGIVGLAAATLLVALLRFVLFAISLPQCAAGARLRTVFDRERVWSLFQLGRWAIADNLSRQLAGISDSILLGIFASMQSVALFGVAGKLPLRLTDVVWRGLHVVFPTLAEHHATREPGRLRQVYQDTWRAVFTGLLPVIVLGSLCARPLLSLWAGPQFEQAASVMRWLLVAMFSVALEGPSDMLLYAVNQPQRAARIAMVEAVANVALSLVLLLRFGVVGLAAGTALTHLALNFGWFTPTACRVAGISLRELLINALRGTQILIGVLALLVVGVAWVTPILPHATVVAAAAAGGLLYLAVWLRQIVQPLRRAEAYAA